MISLKTEEIWTFRFQYFNIFKKVYKVMVFLNYRWYMKIILTFFHTEGMTIKVCLLLPYLHSRWSSSTCFSYQCLSMFYWKIKGIILLNYRWYMKIILTFFHTETMTIKVCLLLPYFHSNWSSSTCFFKQNKVIIFFQQNDTMKT